MLTWIAVPFLAIHFIASHKELRFVFLVMLMMPVFLIYFEEKVQFFGKAYLRQLLIVMNLILLFIVILRPANRTIGLYKYIWTNDSIRELKFEGENPFTQVGLFLNFYKKRNLNLTKVSNLHDKNGYVFLDRGLALKKYV